MDKRLRYAPIELRAAPSAERSGILEGYASVYDVEYRIGYGLSEAIAPGAFADSLAKREGVLPLFYQHEWNNPIGYANAREDATGLHITAHLFIDVNERAASVYAAAEAGALREWSIGFIPTVIETRSEDAADKSVEYVLGADLLEASVVVKGANPATSMIDVRSAQENEEPAPEIAEESEEPKEEAADLLPEYLLSSVEKEHVREILRDLLTENVSTNEIVISTEPI